MEQNNQNKMSTFTITPDDVGRKVRLRNGEVSTITGWSITLQLPWASHAPVCIKDEGWYHINGKYLNPGDLLTDSSKDVVAWADEQVTEQPISFDSGYVQKKLGEYFSGLSLQQSPQQEDSVRPKDLRDEFAMVAMGAMLDPTFNASLHNSAQAPDNEYLAKWSYEIADAMMKAREEK